MKLSDKVCEQLKASLNNAIHEIVFACHHAENDDAESACHCLMTAQDTIDRVEEALVAASEE